MDSKVSYGRRGHAGSGVAWIAKCRTRGFLWAGKRCDSRVAVPRRGVRQLAIHATAESPWRAVAGFPSFPSCFNGSQPGAHSPRGRTIDGVECGTPTPPIRVLRPSVFWSPTGAGDGLVRAGFRCTICSPGGVFRRSAGPGSAALCDGRAGLDVLPVGSGSCPSVSQLLSAVSVVAPDSPVRTTPPDPLSVDAGAEPPSLRPRSWPRCVLAQPSKRVPWSSPGCVRTLLRAT